MATNVNVNKRNRLHMYYSGECKPVQILWKLVWSFLKKIKLTCHVIHLQHPLACNKRLHIFLNRYLHTMFIDALFTISREWILPRHRSTEK